MAKAQLMDYDKALELFEPVLGFEVHVELNTATKMFCGCANEFGSGANTNTCPTCLGLPGGLPQVNEKAIASSIRLGLALGCDIAESSRFARKNYFYPDLAKDFQTSQYDEPIAHDGAVTIELENGRELHIEIERAHMEEDAGKLTHIGGATGRIQGADYSLVDFNRGGVPLVEIVTKMIEGAEGDAPEVGRTYVRAIRDLVKALGVSNARMEEGNVRCDANVSLRRRGSSELGTRTETKNVNSLRSIERAVRYEIQRQAAILDAGGTIVQETRHWHEDTGTHLRRPPEVRRRRLPLLPRARPRAGRVRAASGWRSCVARFRRRRPLVASGSPPSGASPTLEFQDVDNAELLDELEATIAAGATAAAARKWWTGEIARLANAQGVPAGTLVSPQHVAELVALVDAGTLTDRLARQVLEGVIAGEGAPQEVVDARGLAVVSDDGALIAAIDEALAAQPDVLEKIRDGKVQAAGAVIGAVMKAMKGQADAARVRELVLERASQ